MSYQEACAQLYNDRIEQQRRLQEKRSAFRQSVLDRQNKKLQPDGTIKSAHKSEVVVDADFVMPDILPDNEDRLKWLIFQNIELIQNNPERKKEGQANIKRIKAFINEQKVQQGLPA